MSNNDTPGYGQSHDGGQYDGGTPAAGGADAGGWQGSNNAQGYPNEGYANEGYTNEGYGASQYGQAGQYEQSWGQTHSGQQGEYQGQGYGSGEQATQSFAAHGGWGQGAGTHATNGTLVQDKGAAGFFTALFDFSFTHFVTPKVVKFVYMLSTVVIGVAWLFFLIGAFSDSAVAGLVVLVFGPFLALLYLVFIRITLEFYLATVRMSEDIHNRLR